MVARAIVVVVGLAVVLVVASGSLLLQSRRAPQQGNRIALPTTEEYGLPTQDGQVIRRLPPPTEVAQESSVDTQRSSDTESARGMARLRDVRRRFWRVTDWNLVINEPVEPDALATFAEVLDAYEKHLEGVHSCLSGRLADLHEQYVEEGRIEIYGEKERYAGALPGEIIQRGWRYEGGEPRQVVTRIQLAAHADVDSLQQELDSLRRGIASLAIEVLGAKVVVPKPRTH